MQVTVLHQALKKSEIVLNDLDLYIPLATGSLHQVQKKEQYISHHHLLQHGVILLTAVVKVMVYMMQ